MRRDNQHARSGHKDDVLFGCARGIGMGAARLCCLYVMYILSDLPTLPAQLHQQGALGCGCSVPLKRYEAAVNETGL